MRAEAAATSFALKAEALRHKLTLATDAMNLPITIIDGLWDIRDNAMQLATGLADDPFDDFVDSIAGLAEADVAISALTTTLSITRYAISLKKAAQVKHSLIESLNAAEVKLGQSKDLGKLIERLIEKRAKLNDLIPSDVAEAARKREALKDLNTSLERLQQAYARLQLLEPGLRQKIQTLRYKLDEAELKKMRFAAGVAYKGLKASHDVAKLAGGVGTTVAAAINPISIVFMPAALISFGTSTKRAFDSTRDAIRINKDIKSVDQQLLSLRNAVAEAFKPPLTSDKAIDKAIEARPSERAMMRMLLASKDQLKREHKLSATTAVAESFGAVSSALSVASSTLSILGIAGAPASLGVSLGITAAGLLIGGLAAGINVGLWLYKRHAAKQKQDSLHDAQTGLESLKAGGNLDYIAELNPFIAKARRAAMAELKRSSGDINADALGQKVQAKCEAFIRARHVNQHASTVTTLMTRELNEMGQFVYQCVTNPALRERLAQALSPEEQALLKTLINDRPRGQEGSIPPPNPSDKALQRRYLALVANMLALSRQAEAGANGARAGQAQNLTQGTESATNLLMQRFPICSVLALKEESKLAVDGSLALSDMYYAGGHRASSEALMIQMGLAPLAVEDRAAGDYFSPVPQGPLREAAATGLVNLGPQESASSVVSMALRSDPELAKLVLEPHGLADVAPSSMQTSEAENQKLRSSLMEQAGAESAPGQLLARLLGPDRSGTMLLSVDRSNAPLTSRASAGRAILGEGEGRAFSNLVQSYLANREGLAAQRQFLISVDLERSKKDKRSLSIPIRPDLQSMAPDGSARQMDFIACNRSRDRLRPEYVTYEKLGDSWFVRTTEKLARIEMNPEIIEAKIKDVATPYEEKLLYLQVRNDLHENACLVKYSKI
jgi:hypothetical protein